MEAGARAGGRPGQPHRSRNAVLGALFPGGRERRRGAGLGAAPAGGPRSLGGSGIQEGAGARMNLERLRKRVRHYIDQVSAQRGLLGKGRQAPGLSPRKNRSRRGSRSEGGQGGAGSGAGLCNGGERVILYLCPVFPGRGRSGGKRGVRRAGSAACAVSSGSRGLPVGFPGFSLVWRRRRGAAVGLLCSEGVFAGSRPLGLCKLGRAYLRQGETASGSGWTSEKKNLFAERVIRYWNRLPR